MDLLSQGKELKRKLEELTTIHAQRYQAMLDAGLFDDIEGLKPLMNKLPHSNEALELYEFENNDVGFRLDIHYYTMETAPHAFYALDAWLQGGRMAHKKHYYVWDKKTGNVIIDTHVDPMLLRQDWQHYHLAIKIISAEYTIDIATQSIEQLKKSLGMDSDE